MANNTKFSDITPGNHTYCITTDPNVSCMDSVTGTMDLYSNKGKEGSDGFPSGTDGEDGAEYNFVIDFGGGLVSLTSE